MNKGRTPHAGAPGIDILERLETIPPWQKALVLVAVLLAALCALLPDIVFQGKLFLVPDALAPTNFTVAGERSLAAGVYPLWNPYLFCGMPSYGSLMYTPGVYPPAYALNVLQSYLRFPEMTWLLFHYLMAGVGVYLLARALSCRASIAMMAGLLFMIMPNYLAIGANGHGSQACAIAYLPFALLLARRLFAGGGRIVTAGLLAVVLGFQMLRGHVQIAYYTYLAIGLLYLFEAVPLARARAGKRLLAGTGLLAVSVALAAGIAAVLIVPVRQYAAWSIRGGGGGGGLDYAYATGWSLHPKEMLTFVFPWAFGFGKTTYWGELPFTDYPNYLGVVTAILAAIGAAIARGRSKWFLVVAAAAATVLAFGRFFPVLYDPLFKALPYFNKFRVPVMVLIVQQLAITLLMAAGLEAFLSRAAAGSLPKWLAPRRLRWLLVVAAGAAFLALVGSGGVRDGVAKNAAVIARVRPEWIDTASSAYAADLVKTLLVATVGALVLLLAAGKRLGAGTATLALAVVSAVDLGFVDRAVVHPERAWSGAQPIVMEREVRDRYLQPDDAIRFFAADTSVFRVFPVPQAQIGQWTHNAYPFSDNRFMSHGVFSLGGYHAAKLASYQKVMDAMFAEFNRGGYPAAILDMLNAKYFLSTFPLFREGTGFPLVASGEHLFIYENPRACPRVFLVDSVAVMPPDEALRALAAGGFDPARAVILAEEPSPRPASAAGSSARIVSYGANEIRVRARIERACVLVASEIWYPEWTAEVDGAPARILPADYCLRAIPLGPGEHDVRMRIVSPALRSSLAVSIVSLVVALAAPAAAGIASARKRKR